MLRKARYSVSDSTKHDYAKESLTIVLDIFFHLSALPKVILAAEPLDIIGSEIERATFSELKRIIITIHSCSPGEIIDVQPFIEKIAAGTNHPISPLLLLDEIVKLIMIVIPPLREVFLGQFFVPHEIPGWINLIPRFFFADFSASCNSLEEVFKLSIGHVKEDEGSGKEDERKRGDGKYGDEDSLTSSNAAVLRRAPDILIVSVVVPGDGQGLEISFPDSFDLSNTYRVRSNLNTDVLDNSVCRQYDLTSIVAASPMGSNGAGVLQAFFRLHEPSEASRNRWYTSYSGIIEEVSREGKGDDNYSVSKLIWAQGSRPQVLVYIRRDLSQVLDRSLLLVSRGGQMRALGDVAYALAITPEHYAEARKCYDEAIFIDSSLRESLRDSIHALDKYERTQRARMLEEQADLALANKRFREANELYSKSLASSVVASGVYLRVREKADLVTQVVALEISCSSAEKGEDALKAFNFTSARDQFVQASKLSPELIHLHSILGRIEKVLQLQVVKHKTQEANQAMKMFKYKHAHQLLMEAIALAPEERAALQSVIDDLGPLIQSENALARQRAGIAAVDEKKYNIAVGLFTEAISLLPSAPDGDSERASILTDRSAARLELKDLPGALEDCHAALAIKPDLAMAHFRLGVAQFAMNSYDEAVASYEKALKFDSSMNESVKVKMRQVNSAKEVHQRKEREAERAKAKEEERKLLEEKRARDEQIRKEKAEKLAQENLEKAERNKLKEEDRRAKLVRDKLLQQQKEKDKEAEKERIRLEKAERESQKAAEREQARLEKERERERQRLEREQKAENAKRLQLEEKQRQEKAAAERALAEEKRRQEEKEREAEKERARLELERTIAEREKAREEKLAASAAEAKAKKSTSVPASPAVTVAFVAEKNASNDMPALSLSSAESRSGSSSKSSSIGSSAVTAAAESAPVSSASWLSAVASDKQRELAPQKSPVSDIIPPPLPMPTRSTQDFPPLPGDSAYALSSVSPSPPSVSSLHTSHRSSQYPVEAAATESSSSSSQRQSQGQGLGVQNRLWQRRGDDSLGQSSPSFDDGGWPIVHALPRVNSGNDFQQHNQQQQRELSLAPSSSISSSQWGAQANREPSPLMGVGEGSGAGIGMEPGLGIGVAPARGKPVSGDVESLLRSSPSTPPLSGVLSPERFSKGQSQTSGLFFGQSSVTQSLPPSFYRAAQSQDPQQQQGGGSTDRGYSTRNPESPLGAFPEIGLSAKSIVFAQRGSSDSQKEQFEYQPTPQLMKFAEERRLATLQEQARRDSAAASSSSSSSMMSGFAPGNLSAQYTAFQPMVASHGMRGGGSSVSAAADSLLSFQPPPSSSSNNLGISGLSSSIERGLYGGNGGSLIDSFFAANKVASDTSRQGNIASGFSALSLNGSNYNGFPSSVFGSSQSLLGGRSQSADQDGLGMFNGLGNRGSGLGSMLEPTFLSSSTSRLQSVSNEGHIGRDGRYDEGLPSGFNFDALSHFGSDNDDPLFKAIDNVVALTETPDKVSAPFHLSDTMSNSPGRQHASRRDFNMGSGDIFDRKINGIMGSSDAASSTRFESNHPLMNGRGHTGLPSYAVDAVSVEGSNFFTQPGPQSKSYADSLLLGDTRSPFLPASSSSSASSLSSSSFMMPVDPGSGTSTGVALDGMEGMESAVVSENSFPSMKWLRNYGIQMYRWARDDSDWTEYAANIPAPLLPLVFGETATKTRATVDYLQQSSSCRLWLDKEFLYGREETFLVFYRGPSGAPSNSPMDVALDRFAKLVAPVVAAIPQLMQSSTVGGNGGAGLGMPTGQKAWGSSGASSSSNVDDLFSSPSLGPGGISGAGSFPGMRDMGIDAAASHWVGGGGPESGIGDTAGGAKRAYVPRTRRPPPLELNPIAGDYVHRALEIPREVVGLLIGLGGKKIKDFCTASGAKIQFRVNKTAEREGRPGLLELQGTFENVDGGLQLVWDQLQAMGKEYTEIPVPKK